MHRHSFGRKSLMGSTLLGLLIAPSVCVAQSEGQAQPQPQSQSSAQPGRTSDQPSCSDRERALLERIRSLEDRLAKVESTLSGAVGATRPNPSSQTRVVPGIPDQNSLGSTTASRDSTEKPAGDPKLEPGITSEKVPTGALSDQSAQGGQNSQPAQNDPQGPNGQGVPNGPPTPNSQQANGEGNPEATWGSIEPGYGFKVAKTESGELRISAYMVARYLNQLPPNSTFQDHLGNTVPVRGRQDLQIHRILVYFLGWLWNPKFSYSVTLWTVNDTTQVNIVGQLGYAFNKHFNLAFGINGLPGTRSMQGSHPYWEAYDRVMADEFFRPGFTTGIWASGEVLPRLEYRVMLGNSITQLGITGTQLTRDKAKSASLTWMPTTGEFGPRGGFGDFEEHHKLATRFGAAYTNSREDRFNTIDVTAPDNTQIRLGDSLLLFQTGSLAPGVTVQKANYHLTAADAGIKYRGFWLQGEGYYRLLDDFLADGPLPLGKIRDFGFYVQSSYMVVPRKVELYGATSYVFSPMGNSHEFLEGVNYYFANIRNYRINLQVIEVDRSPTSSQFGFYVGGLRGTIIALGATVFF